MNAPLETIALLMAQAPAKPKGLKIQAEAIEDLLDVPDAPDLHDYLGDIGVLEDPGDGEPHPPMPELASARQLTVTAIAQWNKDPVCDLRHFVEPSLPKITFTFLADQRRYDAGVVALLGACDRYQAAWQQHDLEATRRRAWNAAQTDIAWRRLWASLIIAGAATLVTQLTDAAGETK